MYSAGKASGVLRGGASEANRCFVLAHCGGGGIRYPPPWEIGLRKIGQVFQQFYSDSRLFRLFHGCQGYCRLLTCPGGFK